jgi:hypothetical protein
MSCGTFKPVSGGTVNVVFEKPVKNSSSTIESCSVNLGTLKYICGQKCITEACVWWDLNNCKTVCEAHVWGVCALYGVDCPCGSSICVEWEYDYCTTNSESIALWPTITYGINQDAVLKLKFLATYATTLMSDAMNISTSIQFSFISGNIYVKLAGETIAKQPATEFPTVTVTSSGDLHVEFEKWKFSYIWQSIYQEYKLRLTADICPDSKSIVIKLKATVIASFDGIESDASSTLTFPTISYS